MNLNDMIASLEKSAGFTEDLKDKKEDPKDKKEDKKESKDGKEEKEKDAKKDGEGDGSQEKSAAFKSGVQLAQEIMEKVAATQIEQTKGTEMNKQASDAGKALAQALLTKLANVGDENTSVGYAAGVVPNKTQVDIAAQVAEHNNSFQATPGTDGVHGGGSINEIFDAIVADAKAQGVVDQSAQGPTAPAEGAQVAGQTPNQAGTSTGLGQDSQEKSAALVALVNSGIDFEDAVDLIKRASDDLEQEEETQIKQAALNELMDQGVDFDFAVALVKQAGLNGIASKVVGQAHAYGTAAKAMGAKGVAGEIGAAARKGYAAAKGDVKTLRNASQYTKEQVGDAAKSTAKRVGVAAAGGAAVGGAAYAVGHKKKAAVDMLVENGVDFDSAIEMVNDKASELYA